jgi:tetratricopeptide (TPR) repeat protein
VVLDNAARTAQVAPLLPGGGAGTLVLVTSRRRLVGLDGVHPVSLPLLDAGEAVELLARIAGRARVAAEPRAAQEVVRRCGYLPLAVRLAAARLAHRPRWRVADLAERLGEQRAALPELTADDRSVAQVFALSYEQLSPIVRWAFRALALHPGEQFDALAVAALVDLGADAATDALDELVDQHLVEEPVAGRYRLHDLVREYATGLVAADPQSVRSAAVGRLLDHHLHATLTANAGIMMVRPVEGLTEPQRPDLLERAERTADWLERERPNLVPLLRRAVAYGHLRVTWQLARAQWPFLYVHEYLDDLVASHLVALEAARVEGDRRGVATTHNYLASAYFRTSRHERAIEHLLDALRIRDELGDAVGSAIIRGNLAVALCAQGRLREAWDHAVRAAAAWRGSASSYSYPPSLSQLAVLSAMFGRYEDALRYQRWQLQLAAERKDNVRLSTGLGNVAWFRLRLGHVDAAERLLRATVALARRHRNIYVETESTCRLGIALRLRGRLAEAQSYQRESLRISRDVGDRRAELAARTELAITLSVAGEPAEAQELLRGALAVAPDLEVPYERAGAMTALGDVVAGDDPAEARRLWEQALGLYRWMGVPEATEVEARLDRLRSADGRGRMEA